MEMVDFIENFIKEPEGSFDENKEKGSGMYAHVFDSDMPNLVVKRSSTSRCSEGLFTDGWLVWAIYCMNVGMKRGVPYSYMPRIYGLVIDRKQGIFHAVIEKLERYNDRDGVYNYSVHGELDWMMSEDGVRLIKYNSLGKSLVKSMLAMYQDMRKIFGGDVPIYLDAHGSNWMWRRYKSSQKVVLTDPFVMESDYLNTTEKVKEFNELLEKMAEGNPNIKFINA